MTDNNGRALREAKAWAVVSATGHIIGSTVRPLKAESIRAMTGDEGGIVEVRRRWKFWLSRGCRAMRVRVLAVGEDG